MRFEGYANLSVDGWSTIIMDQTSCDLAPDLIVWHLCRAHHCENRLFSRIERHVCITQDEHCKAARHLP